MAEFTSRFGLKAEAYVVSHHRFAGFDSLAALESPVGHLPILPAQRSPLVTRFCRAISLCDFRSNLGQNTRALLLGWQCRPHRQRIILTMSIRFRSGLWAFAAYLEGNWEIASYLTA